MTDAQRKIFEEWFESFYLIKSDPYQWFEVDKDGNYKLHIVNISWQAWAACYYTINPEDVYQ